MFTNLSSSDQLIGLGCVIGLDWVPAPKTVSGSPNYWATTRPYGDSIAYLLGQLTLLRLGFVNCRASVGVFHSGGDNVITRKIVGTRPIASRYNRQLDQDLYGNLLSNLFVFLNNDNKPFPDLGEHNVEHARYTGVGEPIVDTEPPWYYGEAEFGSGAMRHALFERYHTHFRNGPFHRIEVVSTPDGYFCQMAQTHSSTDWARPRAYFDDVVNMIASLVAGGYNSGWSQVNSHEVWLHREIITDFSCDHVPGTNGNFAMEYTHQYEMDRDPCGGGVWASDLAYRKQIWRVKFQFNVVIPSPDELYNAPGTYALTQIPVVTVNREYVNLETTFTQCDGYSFSFNEPTISDGSGGGSAYPCYWCHPFFTTGGVIGDDALGPDDARLALARARQDIRHFVPASALSSIEAVEDLIADHETNFIETLSEVGDLARLVPDLALLMVALRDLKKADLTGVVRLGRFIAETNLKYKFGINPNLIAVTELDELGPRIEALYNAMGEDELHVLYGSYSDTLEGVRYFGYEGNYQFVARSKLVVGIRNTGFLRLFYGATAIGLAPNLRNIWETFPGSFAFDWVLPLRSYFDRLDKEFILLTLLLKYSVHTYTIEDPVPEWQLLPFGIRSLDADPLKRRVFLRHVSLRASLLRDSKFGFLPQSPVPSWDILGSLAWVIGLR